MAKIRFQVGNYKLHDQPNMNFQLNRIQKLGADLNKVREIAAKVTDNPSYVKLMKEAAKEAKAAGDLRAANAYLRGADFFTPAREGKLEIYNEYREIYYKLNEPMMAENNVQKVLIPFGKGFIPVLYCLHENPKGTIVVHGGFDSYVEEFLKFMVYMHQKGYNAYIFEGPGQGACINDYAMPFTPDWDKPVSAVLDHFQLDDVALVGISLGSLLCKRAAAKEHRIKYLMSVGIMTSFYETLLSGLTEEIRVKVDAAVERQDKEAVNALCYEQAEKNPMYDWYWEHGTYVFGVETPYDMLLTAKKYDIEPIADQITQDYLMVAGANDHFVPLHLANEEIRIMNNVRSFTMRIITSAEKGDDHCNVSNRKLMLDFFVNWLEETKREKAETELAIKRGYSE